MAAHVVRDCRRHELVDGASEPRDLLHQLGGDRLQRHASHQEDGFDVVDFDSLLMDFAQAQGASLILRGLRAVADFEYEFQMAGMNQQLNDEIETVFLMADVARQPMASRLVKEIALLGGDIAPFTSPAIAQALIQRCKETK